MSKAQFSPGNVRKKYIKNLGIMEKSSQTPSFGQGLELAININRAIASVTKEKGLSAEEIQAKIGKPGQIYKLVESIFTDDKKTKTNFSLLRLAPISEKLFLEALDGTVVIVNAKNIFSSINSGFSLNQRGSATVETGLRVDETINEGTYDQIFAEITDDLDKIVMTQHQIVRFCEKYTEYLYQESRETFFLSKEDKEYVVVWVNVRLGNLNVDRIKINDDYYWPGNHNRYRFVYPQLPEDK